MADPQMLAMLALLGGGTALSVAGCGSILLDAARHRRFDWLVVMLLLPFVVYMYWGEHMPSRPWPIRLAIAGMLLAAASMAFVGF